MHDWIIEHQSALILWGSISVLVALVTMIGTAVAVVRMPADYFKTLAKPRDANSGWSIVRNVLGWFLIVAGVAMIVLPGPGTIVIIVGILLADFPGKAKVLNWTLARGSVLKSANALRRRYHRPPLAINAVAGQRGAAA
ncbi:hypothetical protein BH11PLA1_BH11PLA1_08070 [soil metagenome]